MVADKACSDQGVTCEGAQPNQTLSESPERKHYDMKASWEKKERFDECCKGDLEVEEANAQESTSGDISEGYAEVPRELNAQVVFVKENVWVWPSRRSRIMGRLSLTLQRGVLFISWLPYSPGTINSDGTFQARPQPVQTDQEATESSNERRARACYAIRPTPVAEIEALTRHTPAIGCHYILLSMRGAVHAPLYFHNGGIKAMLAVLKEHVRLVKTIVDPNTYVITEDCGPLTPQLSIDGGDVHLGGPPRDSDTAAPPISDRPSSGAHEAEDAGESFWLERSMFALSAVEAAAERSLRRLQKFVFPESEAAATEADEELTMNSAMQDLYSQGPLGRARRQHAALIHHGPAAELAAEVSAEELSSSQHAARLERQADTGVGMFEVIEGRGPQTTRRRRSPPVSLGAEEWASFLDDQGRITDKDALWQRIYAGGLAPELRREVWKFLLGVYPIDSTAAQRVALLENLGKQYAAICGQWEGITPAQAARWSRWRERRSQVEKDVVRTDRDSATFSSPDSPALVTMQRVLLSYVMYNQDLGYSQGMSDILSPLLLVMPSEVEAFWCFAALMDRVGGNFDKDQTCCQLQLAGLRRLVQVLDPPLHAAIKAASCLDYLFCFRWILVVLKREFVLSDVPALWEVLWTNPFTPNLHIYVAFVLLESRRHQIMQEGLHYGRMHVICGSLRGAVDVHATMSDAEAVYTYAGDAGLACIADVPKPSLQQRQQQLRPGT